jgi:hypothetical protein
MAEEVGGNDAILAERCGERAEVAAMVPDAVQADDARSSSPWAELVECERHPEATASSDSGTISVRRSSRSFTSDQMTVPALSIRNVPRCGAPFASLKTP